MFSLGHRVQPRRYGQDGTNLRTDQWRHRDRRLIIHISITWQLHGRCYELCDIKRFEYLFISIRLPPVQFASSHGSAIRAYGLEDTDIQQRQTRSCQTTLRGTSFNNNNHISSFFHLYSFSFLSRPSECVQVKVCWFFPDMYQEWMWYRNYTSIVIGYKPRFLGNSFQFQVLTMRFCVVFFSPIFESD